MAIGIGIGISLDNGKGSVTTPTPIGNLITITTTLTGDFIISLDGVGTCVITWPDLTTSDVVMTGGGAVTTTKALVGGGTITISNPAILTYIAPSNNEITDCDIPSTLVALQYLILNNNQLTAFTAHAEWTALLYLDLDVNALDVTSINNILINALASGITTGTIDLTGGTNAAPTGAGITAADALNTLGVTVTANGYTWP